ncbi:hypothetical protein F4677DRAFT_417500 [Hypoxylon crocopeplum]|nr:hypothetical protein F4677DRAFT_417500 [Hypoxylon crocopeplum]
MHTAGTIGVILVPVGLIAIMLAIWYCPFRHASNPRPCEERGNIGAAGVNNTDVPHTTPSYELQPHQSSRLSRISEEGGPFHHTNLTAVHR